jgi:hypothetical protein
MDTSTNPVILGSQVSVRIRRNTQTQNLGMLNNDTSAGMAHSAQRLATDWTAEDSEFYSL